MTRHLAKHFGANIWTGLKMEGNFEYFWLRFVSFFIIRLICCAVHRTEENWGYWWIIIQTKRNLVEHGAPSFVVSMYLKSVEIGEVCKIFSRISLFCIIFFFLYNFAIYFNEENWSIRLKKFYYVSFEALTKLYFYNSFGYNFLKSFICTSCMPQNYT